jgi:hypothetical protein
MNRCGECKWWIDTYCTRIPCTECTEFSFSDKPMAFIHAGSWAEGDAELETKPDFGCVLWEGK